MGINEEWLRAQPGFSAEFHLGETAEPAVPAPDLEGDEKAFQAAVVKLAKRNGCMVFHVYNSRKSEPGWPDLFILRGHKCWIRELKVPPNTTTPEQDEWLAALRQAGFDVAVWEPKDWKEIERTLAR